MAKRIRTLLLATGLVPVVGCGADTTPTEPAKAGTGGAPQKPGTPPAKGKPGW